MIALLLFVVFAHACGGEHEPVAREPVGQMYRHEFENMCGAGAIHLDHRERPDLLTCCIHPFEDYAELLCMTRNRRVYVDPMPGTLLRHLSERQ